MFLLINNRQVHLIIRLNKFIYVHAISIYYKTNLSMSNNCYYLRISGKIYRTNFFSVMSFMERVNTLVTDTVPHFDCAIN